MNFSLNIAGVGEGLQGGANFSDRWQVHHAVSALTASLASEVASYRAAMQSAESHINERLEDLTSPDRQHRQSA